MDLNFEQLLAEHAVENEKIADISSNDFFTRLTEAIAEGVALGINEAEKEKKT